MLRNGLLVKLFQSFFFLIDAVTMLQKHLLHLYFVTPGSVCETTEQHGSRKAENDKYLTTVLESLAQLLLTLFKQFVCL